MTQERAPESEQSLVGDDSETTSWELARENASRILRTRERAGSPPRARTVGRTSCR